MVDPFKMHFKMKHIENVAKVISKDNWIYIFFLLLLKQKQNKKRNFEFVYKLFFFKMLIACSTIFRFLDNIGIQIEKN